MRKGEVHQLIVVPVAHAASLWMGGSFGACVAAWAAIARGALRLADPWSVRQTLSYCALHVCLATLLAYVLVGSWWAALILSLLQPAVQALSYCVHKRLWGQPSATRAHGRVQEKESRMEAFHGDHQRRYISSGRAQ